MKIFQNILFFIFFSAVQCFSQNIDTSVIKIDKIPADGILLNSGWKFQAGDNREYAEPGFDDQHWKPVNPTKDIRSIPELWKTHVGWFRLHFVLGASITQKALAILVEQTGASEIYLNGQLIERFGIIGSSSRQVLGATPIRGTFIGLPTSNQAEQVLSVRYAVQKNLPYVIFGRRQNTAFALRAMEIRSISRYFPSNINLFFDYMRGGLFLVLSMLHLALFWFNPSQKANLYFFISAFLLAAFSFLISLVFTHVHLAATKQFFLIAAIVSWLLGYFFFLPAVYEMFGHPKGLIYRLIAAGSLLSIMLFFINYHKGGILAETVFPVLVFLDTTRITAVAAKQKKRGAKIVIAGAAGFLVFYVLFRLIATGLLPEGLDLIYRQLAFNFSNLLLPASISVYLALEASYTSHSLQEKLNEVQQLSEKTIAQEQEKQEILASQKDTLELQVAERTAELKQSLEELKTTQTQLVQSEKMASLGELTAGIAHEIQNPLNFVNNFSEVSVELIDELENELKEGYEEAAIALAADIKQNLQKVTEHGKRADAIVKGMLQHSRASTGKKEWVDINALADEYLRLGYHGLRAKDKSFDATIETHFDESIGKIKVVPQDIGRVSLNLFNNAFYAVAERKKQVGEDYQPNVSVSTKKENDKLIIVVKDNGTGIPQKAVEKIFQPFFTTKPTGQGTGLGLSLSYDIIKAHGGEIKVSTEEGEGAEFIIQLPIG